MPVFFEQFQDWAREQAAQWGFFAEPSLELLRSNLIAADPEGRLALQEARKDRLSTVANSLVDRIGRPAGQQTSDPPDWPVLDLPKVKLTDEQILEWLEVHPNHPDLLEAITRRMIDRDRRSDPKAIDLLERYRRARPIDPYPDRVLAPLVAAIRDPRAGDSALAQTRGSVRS